MNMSASGFLSGLVAMAMLMSGIAAIAGDQRILSCRDGSVVTATAGARSRVGSAVDPKSHSVKLSWRASPSVVAGYLIERREPGGDYSPLSLQLVRGTTCIDFDVVAGHIYYYRAKSVGNGGARSIPSAEARAVVPH